MENIQLLLAIAAVVAGTFFSIVGIVGYWRLPDVYTRLHATGKVGTFGVVLLLLAGIATPQLGAGKALLLAGLLLLSGPVTAHAMSSAAYRLKIPLKPSVRDDLRSRLENGPLKQRETPQ